MRIALALVLASVVAVPTAFAQRQGGRQQQVRLAPVGRPAAQRQQTNLEDLDPRFVHSLVRQVNTQRRQAVQARARFFSKITVQKDYRGEHVLYRDHEVTAFLDMSDPQHPRFDPKEQDDVEEELENIPLQRRAHILVVPNVPREHIGRTLGSSVTSSDLETTLKVVKSAEALAQRLGIKNAKVFVNPQDRVMIGYLHVHIIGERDPKIPYPPPLKP